MKINIFISMVAVVNGDWNYSLLLADMVAIMIMMITMVMIMLIIKMIIMKLMIKLLIIMMTMMMLGSSLEAGSALCKQTWSP